MEYTTLKVVGLIYVYMLVTLHYWFSAVGKVSNLKTFSVKVISNLKTHCN